MHSGNLPSSYPLTSMQKGMVLASMRAARSRLYVLQMVCELAEPPDVPLLKRAWSRVAQRHPALRSRIETADGQFRQCALENPEYCWQELDWSDLPRAEQREKWDEFLRQDRERGFDFAAGVPARFAVLHTSDRSSTLLWTIHHVLVDGGSSRIVWEEWLATYDGLVQGQEVPLEEPVAFRHYLEWLEQRDWTAAEHYWRDRLAGLSQTDYVTERLRQAGALAGGAFAKESVSLTEELTRGLEGFAESHKVSVSTLVLGAWALLLSRYSGRTDVVFGVTGSGRAGSLPEARRIVGSLINTLPLRIAVPPDAPLPEWLKQIRAHWKATRPHEHTPLELVREWSGLPPGTAIFDNTVVYDHERLGETLQRLGGAWQHRNVRFLSQRTDSALTLAAYGRPVLALQIIFDTRLFAGETIASMTGHLETLLGSFLTQPEARLAELTILTEAERKRFVEWNRTEHPFPRTLCIHQLFEQQADRLPEKTALDHAGDAITYRELNGRANQLAWWLREGGVGPEDRIAVRLDDYSQAVIAILGILKAGACFVPLASGLPAERLASMLTDSGARLLLTRETDAPELDGVGCQVCLVERLGNDLAGRPQGNLPCYAAPENAAYAIYTSGSTGRPKAVVATHRSLVNHTLAASQVYGITEADRRLQFAAMGTDFFIGELFNYICHGATLVSRRNVGGMSVREFLRFLVEHRITITGVPSTWWQELIAGITEGGVSLPPTLRGMITGMERVNPAAFREWNRAVGKRVRWFNAYGPTEATCTATIYEAGSSEWEGEAFVPIGKPVANTRAYVLDGAGSPVPVGVAGELYLGGEGVTRGYLNAPELTAERFVPDPFFESGEGRMYRTGDLVFYLPDGNLVYLGRADRQVKIRGFRVELEEIEAVLAQHAGVRQCAVVLARQAEREILVAYITASGPEAPSAEQLRLHLSRLLPAHMIPAGFVTLAEMPLTSSGKIDRQSLPPCAVELRDSAKDFQPPSTPTEERLAEIWREVLGVRRVGATDDFFELGGDSLGATQLLAAVERRFGRELPLAVLFRSSTVARMAAALDGHKEPHRWQSLVSIQEGGARPPLFLFHALHGEVLFYRELALNLGSDQPVYGLRSVGLDGTARPLETVEAMAAHYLREIREIQPDGPYHLGGFCFGAYVALEAARQLEQEGNEVAVLACFDTDGRWRMSRSFSKGLALHFQSLEQLRGRARIAYLAQRAAYRLRRVRSGVVEMYCRGLEAGGYRLRTGLRHAHVREMNLKASRAYRAGGVQTCVAYFQPVRSLHSDPAPFWAPIAGGGLEAHLVESATGLEMFEKPGVAALAGRLSAVLEGLRTTPAGQTASTLAESL